MPRRPSTQTLAVLSALAGDPGRWRYGYELGQEVDLRAGSLYPILMRMHDRGLLESSWEPDPPPGRPARHLYRLTAAGVRTAAEQTAAVPALSAAEKTRATTEDRPLASHRPALGSAHTARLAGAS